MNGRKVFVGMSGGVDSSVAAALLQEQGYDVVGVFMKNWSNDEFTDCPWEQDFADAKAVADKLGMPIISWNFEKEYRSKVIEYFFAEYAAGRTPNPDVMCNKEIKFGLFMDRAFEEGADYISTGHYAQIIPKNGQKWLAMPKDRHKDQTYFLYTLTPSQLNTIIFPLSGLTKDNVRAKAHALELPNAQKPDSQGICFIGEVNVVHLLKSRLPERPGLITTIEGDDVGEHRGVWFFTIGQRHGLGIGGGIPYYVAGKDVPTNTLIVASGDSHPALFSSKMEVEGLFWRLPRKPGRVSVRLRHGAPLVPATIRISRSKAIVRFDDDQRAVTPGQAAVFYLNDVVVGGGAIAESRPAFATRSPQSALARIG